MHSTHRWANRWTPLEHKQCLRKICPQRPRPAWISPCGDIAEPAHLSYSQWRGHCLQTVLRATPTADHVSEWLAPPCPNPASAWVHASNWPPSHASAPFVKCPEVGRHT